MTVETKLALTNRICRSFSEAKMNQNGSQIFVLEAFGELENLPMPKPDKTKIAKWNFTEFPVHTVESEYLHLLMNCLKK